MAYKTN